MNGIMYTLRAYCQYIVSSCTTKTNFFASAFYQKCRYNYWDVLHWVHKIERCCSVNNWIKIFFINNTSSTTPLCTSIYRYMYMCVPCVYVRVSEVFAYGVAIHTAANWRMYLLLLLLFICYLWKWPWLMFNRRHVSLKWQCDILI